MAGKVKAASPLRVSVSTPKKKTRRKVKRESLIAELQPGEVVVSWEPVPEEHAKECAHAPHAHRALVRNHSMNPECPDCRVGKCEQYVYSREDWAGDVVMHRVSAQLN